ncbi:MAG: hypothetical protein IJX20_04255 [Alphaproteobacteria bacterium]|nr:hypothetical protein [Alphaproteobacteria bacterium]
MIVQIVEKIYNWWKSPELYYALVDNRFFLIVLVIILLRLNRAAYRSLWLCALINIPGTILHELMHLLVGGFMNARPCNFTIIPKRDVSGTYVMGSVGFRNICFYNAIPAALAPLLLLPIGFYINRYVLPLIPMNLTNYILYVLMQTIIVQNAVPSQADWRIAGMYKSGVVLYLILLGAVILMF